MIPLRSMICIIRASLLLVLHLFQQLRSVFLHELHHHIHAAVKRRIVLRVIIVFLQ